jgi:hypothetical protein
MEAASRPSLDPLPDLPVEAPVDASSAPAKAAAALTAPAAAAGEAAAAKQAEQTGITFLDPDSLVMDTAEVPALSPPVLAAAVQADRSTKEYELTLEDPVVDEMLSAPPPPPSAKSAPVVAAPAAVVAPAVPDSVRTEARVPIARTGSLSSAAAKLAAASQRTTEQRSPKPAPAARTVPAATAPASSGAAAQAQSLADWTSARAAAAPSPKPKATAPAIQGVPAAPAPQPAPAAKPAVAAKPAKPAAAPPAPAAPATTANATTLPASPPMDKDFIARNQVVERYLSGRLPLKGAAEFEQYCGKHPELLDEIGLPERVNAGLRLLEASGKPEPWQEPTRPGWQKPQVTVTFAVVALVCGVAAAALAGAGASKGHRIEQLQKQLTEQPLDPATSTREIRLLPSREGASNSPAISIGGGGAQMADFKIDESRSPYHIFRVTIDRVDQGRVGIITNLVKDSNGHLRIALNSSALGPGNYQLTIEGIDWRGDPQPDSWITIGVQR